MTDRVSRFTLYFIVPIILQINYGIGCDCTGPGPPGEEFEARDAVFVGQVVRISTETVESPLDYLVRVGFLVEYSWKGVDAQEVEILTGYDEGQCGYYFEMDTVYLVYADSFWIYSDYTPDDTTLQTHICTRTKRLSQADEDLQFLSGLQVDPTEARIETISKAFWLYPNYPNPLNPSTTIEFSMSKSGLITLSVYDILGREVETLLNQRMDVGHHKVQWNASNVPSGIYFIRMLHSYCHMASQVKTIHALRCQYIV